MYIFIAQNYLIQWLGGRRGWTNAYVSIAIISNYFYSERIVRMLHDGVAVRKIEMDIITAGNPDVSRHVVIRNKALLNQINQALRASIEIAPDSPRQHNIYINMFIYKDEKINIQVLNTKNNGWIIAMGGNWYKSDTLAGLLKMNIHAN